ncbi:MAG: hypothetical protein IAF08_06085, partial [Rhizobacter sp.]|nr:hypothetical protein [Chlorobiales bacterium]
FGLEYGVLDWLTLRLGYTRTNSAITNTAKTEIAASGAIPASNSTTTTVNPNGVSGNSFSEYASFGTGFRIGDLNLDVSIANSFFKNGPWVVGGGSTSPLFGQMSAHFSF